MLNTNQLIKNGARAACLTQQQYNLEISSSPQTFGPTSVYNTNLIRLSLGCHNLTNLQILSMTRDALLHGYKLNDKVIFQNNTYCHKFVHQNMTFVLSEGFDVVITIFWDKNPTIIGNCDSSIKSSHIIHSPNTTAPSSIAYNNNNDDYESMIDEECIDEIVNNLISADLDDDIMTRSLPPIPAPQPIQINTTNTSTYSYSINTNYSPNNSYTNINTPPGNDMENISLNTEYNDNNNNSNTIIINNKLWNDINNKFNGHFQNKQELINLIHTAIYVKNVQCQSIEEYTIWMDSFYVYLTKYNNNDSYILYDVFDYKSYQNNYAQCINKHTKTGINNTNSNILNVPVSNGFIPRKLTKNSSKRSIISNTSSSSRRSVLSDNEIKEYHTIYLKPIIERMKKLTNSQSIDTDYIISIVDISIKNGTKRQISKRTFEFKYKSYTIVMSKSLKTILDVTLSDIKDIITVHPDVVSIISKKCPILDYFTIQKLANKAKLTKTFTTKKNDYRQQFIYDFCGCRIVFASNHTTIVEMQCNQPKLLQLN